jgi:hypothetical protein
MDATAKEVIGTDILDGLRHAAWYHPAGPGQHAYCDFQFL